MELMGGGMKGGLWRCGGPIGGGIPPGGGIGGILGSKGGRPKGGRGGGGGPRIIPKGGGGRIRGGGPRITAFGGGAGPRNLKACCWAILSSPGLNRSPSPPSPPRSAITEGRVHPPRGLWK